jgi:hypothetical protein
MNYAAPIWQVRQPFPIKIRQECQPVRARRGTDDIFFHCLHLPAEKIAHAVDGVRGIHGTSERQPVIGAVAKRRNFSARIVCGEHVVAATSTDENITELKFFA